MIFNMLMLLIFVLKATLFYDKENEKLYRYDKR